MSYRFAMNALRAAEFRALARELRTSAPGNAVVLRRPKGATAFPEGLSVSFDLDAWLLSVGPKPPIVQAGAAILRRRASPVPASVFGTRALTELVRVMTEVMRAAPGVGLAAPQIGVPLRIFVAEDDEPRMSNVPAEVRALRRRQPLPLTVLINPSLRAVTEEEATFFEGCLSVRGYGALVRRAASVEVKGTGLTGEPTTLSVDGWAARIMQHELDHLDGTLYVDRMISRSLAHETELTRLSAQSVSSVLRDLG